MRNTVEIFASTIHRLSELSLAELASFKIATACLAFGDPDPDAADDDVTQEYADEQTEAYLALLDLVDQELERRRGRVIVTEIDPD